MGPIRCQSSHTQPCRRASRARRVDERQLVEPRGGGWHHTVPSSRRLHGVPVSVGGRSAPECTSSKKVHFVIRVVLWLKHFTKRRAKPTASQSARLSAEGPRPDRVCGALGSEWCRARGGCGVLCGVGARSRLVALPCWCVDVCAITKSSARVMSGAGRSAAPAVLGPGPWLAGAGRRAGGSGREQLRALDVGARGLVRWVVGRRVASMGIARPTRLSVWHCFDLLGDRAACCVHRLSWGGTHWLAHQISCHVFIRAHAGKHYGSQLFWWCGCPASFMASREILSSASQSKGIVPPLPITGDTLAKAGWTSQG